jgi:hypothetical protein
MLVRSIRGWFVIVLLASALGAQDKKPEDARARAKPFEGLVAGRKASLTLGESWIEFKPAAIELPPSSAPWKPVGAWKSRKCEELTIRLFGIESAGATATTVRDAWFDLAKSKGTPGIIVKADLAHPKDKTLTGHDLECDFKNGGEKSYWWIRAVNVGKDKVAVLLCEERPLKPGPLEAHEPNVETFVRDSHVAEVLPVLASFLQPNPRPEEAWLRGPTFEVSYKTTSVTIDAPKGWAYSRRGAAGDVMWSAPGNPDCNLVAGFGRGSFMLLQVERDLIERGVGKILQDRAIESPATGTELTFTSTGFGKTVWIWRRVFERDGVCSFVETKIFVKDNSASPSADVLKSFTAFHDSAHIK